MTSPGRHLDELFDHGDEEVARLEGAGRLDEAIDRARARLAAGALPPARATRLRLHLASLLTSVGRPAEATVEADALLAERDLPAELAVAADVHRLISLVTQGELARARAHAEDALAGRGPAGDDGLAGAVAVMALDAWADGRACECLRLLDVALRRAELGPAVLRRLNLRLAMGVVLGALGDVDAARDALARAGAEIEAARDPFWSAGPDALRAWLELGAGRPDVAEEAAHAALRTTERFGAAFFRPSATWVLGMVALQRGDVVAAARHIVGFDDLARPSGGLSQGAYLWAAAQVADAQGRRPRAVAVLRPLYGDVDAHRRLLLDEPGAAAWLVRFALAGGDEAGAAAVAACAARVADANPGIEPVEAAAAQARALLERDATAAVRASVLHRHPWPRASAHEDAGVLLVDDGDGRAGAAHLGAAVDTYRSVGATRDAVRAERRWATVAGGRGGRPVEGWASLTEAERRVARLVAAGVTNAEAAEELHLSRHTVDFHLRQVYRKLAIRSRVELAVVVARGQGRSGVA